MGFWSNVARIGGYAAAPFTGGLSIPIGEAVAQGIGNKQATDKANEQLQAGVGQAEGALSPYTQLGGQAANTLSGLMGLGGLPGQAQGAAEQAAAAPPVPTQTGAQRLMAAVPEGMHVGRGGGAIAQRTLADLAAPTMARQQTQSSFVRMRAPDGEERDVPQDQVPYLTQRGAVPVEARA